MKFKLKKSYIIIISILTLLIIAFYYIYNDLPEISINDIEKIENDYLQNNKLGKSLSPIKEIMIDLSRYSVYKHQFSKGDFYFINNNIKNENIVIKLKSKNTSQKYNYNFNVHKLPRFSERHASEQNFENLKNQFVDKNDIKGDLLNILFIVKNKEQLIQSFNKTGWRQPSLTKYLIDPLYNENNFPISNLYLFNRIQDLSFSINTSLNIKHRHHIRLWKTSFKNKGKEVWIAGATKDIAVEKNSLGIINGITSHLISPDVDKEKQYIKDIFNKKINNLNIDYIDINKQILEAVNGNLDPYISDSKILVLELN